MFQQMRIDILGVVENMGTHICSACGHEEAIFGTGGGALLSRDYDTELLGSLPLDLAIRENTDRGTPIVVALPDGAVAQAYLALADRVMEKVEALSVRGSQTPTISVTDD